LNIILNRFIRTNDCDILGGKDLSSERYLLRIFIKLENTLAVALPQLKNNLFSNFVMKNELWQYQHEMSEAIETLLDNLPNRLKNFIINWHFLRNNYYNCPL